MLKNEILQIRREKSMVTLTNAEKALKTYYLGVIAEQLNTDTPLLARIEQTSSDIWGNEIRKFVPCSSGGCNDEGTLRFVLPLKSIYETIEISDSAIRASEKSAGAFTKLLENTFEELIHRSKFNFGRMLYGDGSGTLCKVTAVSGNELTVDGVNNVMEGMVVDVIGNTGKTAVVSARRVTNVDREGKKITLGGAALTGTVTVGDLLTKQGRYNEELTGLGAIFGDSETLYGLDRKTHKWLNPHKYSFPQINDDIIQKVIDELDEVGSTVDFILCSNGVRFAYQDYLIAKRTNIDVITLRGGYKAISYNGIPVVSDRFVPEGTMYLLNTADFHLHRLCDWRWLEEDDGRVILETFNKQFHIATLVKYANLICDRPIGQAVINGIKEK